MVEKKMEPSASPAAETVHRLSDEALFLRWRKENDAAAMDILIERHQVFAYRTALYVCRRRELAEEAAQDAFLDIVRGKHKRDFVAEGEGSFRRWFSTILLNKVHQAMRGERRLRERVRGKRYLEEVRMRETVETAAGTPTSEEEDETKKALDKALLSLRDELRVPVALHFLEGCSQAEIGGLLGISASMVSLRIKKGLELLRKRLAAGGITLSGAALAGLLRSSGGGGGGAATLPPELAKFLGNLTGGATRQAAAHTVRGTATTASIKLWPAIAVTVLCGSAVGGGAWWWSQGVEENTGGQASPTARSNTPAATEKKHERIYRRWSFDKGIPPDLKPLWGKWVWSKDDKGGMASIEKAAYKGCILPVKLPPRPIKVTIKAKVISPDRDIWVFPVWTDLRGIPPLTYWKPDKPVPLKGYELIYKTFFFRRYLVAVIYEADNDKYKGVDLCETTKDYLMDHLLVHIENGAIREIIVREVDWRDIPKELRDVETLKKKLKRHGSVGYERFPSIPPVTDDAE